MLNKCQNVTNLVMVLQTLLSLLTNKLYRKADIKRKIDQE